MAETLDSYNALKVTTSPSQSHESLPSQKLHSPNEGETEEALHDDTNYSQNDSVLLLKKPECCFYGYEQDSEKLKTAVIQDSPSGDVAYDAALVSTVSVVSEIQEPPSSRVVSFSDDAIDSRNEKNREEKFADDSIDSRAVTKQEGKFSDDAIGSRTVKKQEKFKSLKCSLKIQVIDETALIESPCLGNGTFNNRRHQKPKEKRPKRRVSKAAKKVDCGFIGSKGKKRLMHSRKEMEALRFVGLEAQKNKWIEIYRGLSPLVAKEYDELSHHQKKNNATSFDFDPRPQFLRASVPHRYLDAVAARREGNHVKVSVR